MQRRAFLKSLLASGVMLGAGPLSLSRAFGASADKFFVFVGAGGGWDVTSFCDPKGDQVIYSDERGPLNHYRSADIRRAGNIRYAPLPPNIDLPETDQLQLFFEQHYRRMVVFNGVDYGTNNHRLGSRAGFTGSLANGMPATGAIIAEPQGRQQPLAFYDGGGYTGTEGLLPATKLGSVDRIERLVTPNPYLPDEVFEQVVMANDSRLLDATLRAQTAAEALAVKQLADARGSNTGLGSLLNYLPEQPGRGSYLSAEIATAAFAAGLSTSASLRVGGFDTHSDNDQRVTNALGNLLGTVNHLWSRAEVLGIADRLVIVMSGDFGRTPWYNKNNGKDHWPVGSMLVMGAGIRGNRVVGATNDQFRAQKINPRTLAQDDTGITLTPGHIHQAVRRLAGIDAGHWIEQRHPLAVEELDLLT